MTNDGGMALRDVVVDSSLLYGAASRRFVMNLWEMDGLRVPVLPKGVEELFGILRSSEMHYWDTRFEKEAQRTGRPVAPDVRQKTRLRASTAVGEWVNEELGWDDAQGRSDSCLQAIAMDADQNQRASAITSRIPLFCFRGKSKDNYLGDRMLIGQCLAAGFRIFAAENRNMMVRNRINGWLMANGYANEDVVLNGDDAIERAGFWRSRPNELLEAALRAALPQAPRSPKREDEIVTNLLAQMSDQGLPLTADACLDAWLSPDMPKIYESAKAFIAEGGSRARATEQRRLDRRDAAERGAGYSR